MGLRRQVLDRRVNRDYFSIEGSPVTSQFQPMDERSGALAACAQCRQRGNSPLGRPAMNTPNVQRIPTVRRFVKEFELPILNRKRDGIKASTLVGIGRVDCDIRVATVIVISCGYLYGVEWRLTDSWYPSPVCQPDRSARSGGQSQWGLSAVPGAGGAGAGATSDACTLISNGPPGSH